MDAISFADVAFKKPGPSERVRQPRPSEPERLVALVTWAIGRKAGARVEKLRVCVESERVVLTGRCPSFYCKQLAQTAAMRILGTRQLVNQIEVEQG